MNEMNANRESEDVRAPAQSKPMFKRMSTWVAGAILAPVIAAVLGAIILKSTGLDSSSGASNPSHSPAMVGAALKANVFTGGFREDYTVVFPKLYALNVWQRNHSAGYEVLGNNIGRFSQSLIASGGVFRSPLIVTVSITNMSDNMAEIIHASIVNRKWSKPWDGTLIYLPPQGGSVNPSKMAFDLDRVVPTAGNVGKYDRPVGGSFFSRSVIQLPPGEPTTIRLLFTTYRYAVSFKIAFKYVINGKARTLIVGQGARPFIVSAINCKGSLGGRYQRIYSPTTSVKGILQVLDAEEARVLQRDERGMLCDLPPGWQ